MNTTQKTVLETPHPPRSGFDRARHVRSISSVISRLVCLACIAAISCSFAREDVPSAPDILTVAVFDFESSDESVRNLGPRVAALVSAQLSTDARLITVERAELDKALSEQELSLSGTVRPDTAAAVGQLTGAKVLVSGRVFQVEKNLVIVAKIIGTETSRVYGELVKGAGTGALLDLSDELAAKISRTVFDKRDTLVAKVRTREERIARLINSLKDGGRPTVSVRIDERHFGAPTRDPAAETELMLILQKAGFTLLDGQSREEPDLEITGEAFSTLGMRRGNLVSCSARVELKARHLQTGRLLAADRQTSVAVDLSEQIAAKNALQNAALDLAERIVPRLLQ